jgi:hypothetical protein
MSVNKADLKIQVSENIFYRKEEQHGGLVSIQEIKSRRQTG